MSLIRYMARRGRPFVAAALMVSLVTTLLGPLVHADDGHDADFSPPIVHDASQHRWTAGKASTAEPAAEQHCVACHVVRLVREGPVVSLAAQPLLLGAGILFDRAVDAHPQISGPPLPARAPPVSLVA